MSAFYRTSAGPSPTDWQGMIKEIQDANQKRNHFLSIMTEYERRTVAEYMGGIKEKYRPTIEAGALAVWNGAKSNLKAALANVETQKRKVTNSWDASKLAPEMQVYSMRIDVAAENADLDALQRISQDAKNSGDPYKIRACSEMLGNLVKKIPPGTQDSHGVDMRLAANRISLQARRDLEDLQTSPELTQAHEQTAAKVAELNAAKSLLLDTAETMGDTAFNGELRNTRFEKAIQSVQQDSDGNFIFTDKE